MLTLRSPGRITFLACNQQVGICLISTVQLSLESSFFIRSCILADSKCCDVGIIFMCLISFLIKVVVLPPSLYSQSSLYPKYFRKFNFAEGCRRVSFINANWMLFASRWLRNSILLLRVPLAFQNRIFVLLLRKVAMIKFEYTGEEGVEISGKSLSWGFCMNWKSMSNKYRIRYWNKKEVLNESVVKCENFLAFVGVGARTSGLKTRVEGIGWVEERLRDPMA